MHGRSRACPTYSALRIHGTRPKDLRSAEAMLLLVEPVNNKKLVPCRICRHLLKPCQKLCCCCLNICS